MKSRAKNNYIFHFQMFKVGATFSGSHPTIWSILYGKFKEHPGWWD